MRIPWPCTGISPPKAEMPMSTSSEITSADCPSTPARSYSADLVAQVGQAVAQLVVARLERLDQRRQLLRGQV